jgi:hypothetical protein
MSEKSSKPTSTPAPKPISRPILPNYEMIKEATEKPAKPTNFTDLGGKKK